MEAEQISELFAKIDALDSQVGKLQPRHAERLLMEVLTRLLRNDGYDVTTSDPGEDWGVDFVAQKAASGTSAPVSVGIEYKHYRTGTAVGLSQVGDLLGAAIIRGLDRVMLVTNSKFSASARAMVQQELPVVAELVDLAHLRAWASRLQRSADGGYSRILRAIRDLSQRLARLVAEDPASLSAIEWRDMERMLAAVFQGLGFTVKLTASSKDGGKDIVLGCLVSGEAQSYLVEVKHWRSGKLVGPKPIRDFVNVIARENRHGGLYIATYGYADTAFETLSEVERCTLRFGDKEKIVALCQTYVKAESGIWSAPPVLPELLFERTL